MRYIKTNSLKRLFSIKRRSFDGDIPSPKSAGEEDNKRGFDGGDPAKASFQRPSWRCFSYEEIFEATNGFSPDNLVGKGGYAEVYKGKLGGDNAGEEIAVKRLTRASTDERKVKEFLTEIGTIGHVRHPNVLSLLGCCIDNGLYIIFLFSSRGSLSSLLHGDNPDMMDWETRYKVAVGTARGLHYLHKGCKRRIIHRDIKSSNILLTSDFEPLVVSFPSFFLHKQRECAVLTCVVFNKISDFGLAKWLPWQWSHHSIAPIEGTFG